MRRGASPGASATGRRLRNSRWTDNRARIRRVRKPPRIALCCGLGFRGAIMAAKIPGGAPVAHAYGFAFGNIVNNLGMIWIPVALLWTATYFLQRPYLDATAGAMGPQAALAAMPLIFGYC